MDDLNASITPIEWRDGQLILLDQRALPQQVEYVACDSVAAICDAIVDMTVRGAPAIGVTAAYAVAIAARDAYQSDALRWREIVAESLRALAATRPTAVNLDWALQRMVSVFDSLQGDPFSRLLTEALAIHAQERAANLAMGEHGAALLGRQSAVLTHCNTGALATGGHGTALSVITSGHRAGRIAQVYACETRPWLQGARLTAWELAQHDIPVKLLVDSAAAYLMHERAIDWVIVGADRIAANGDVANKIGTYALAIAARRHGAQTMVVAPLSTIDSATINGAAIPVETRAAREVLGFGELRTPPATSDAWNPVFDVTPAELIDVIVTERGVIEAPDRARIAAHLS